MITIVQTEATCASENLEHILTHDCNCRRRICLCRLGISMLVIALLVVASLAVMHNRKTLGHEITFSLVSFCSVLAVVVLLGTPFQCRHMVFCPTGSPLYRCILYFDKGDLDALVRLLDTGEVGSAADGGQLPLPRPRAWGNVMLAARFSRDGRMAFCRLMGYEGFGYVPIAKDHYYTDNDAERVRRFFDDCRCAR